MNQQVLNTTSKKKLANMLYQAHNSSKHTTFSKLVIIQWKIKTLSEGVMISFYTKIFRIYRTSDLWKICWCYFCLNEMRRKIAKPIYLTSQMPFAARFSVCATIDFNSILKCFRGGYDNKLYIKMFGIYRTIDLWKNRFSWNFTERSVNHWPVLRPPHS